MLSIFLTLCGIYTVATGRLASILSGGKGQRVSGQSARTVGVMLALAFPLSIAMRLILAQALGESALMFGSAVEIVVALLVLLSAYAAGRRMRHVSAGM